MREEYDFSDAVRSGRAERMRKHGYTTTVHHRDGSKTVTHFAPKQDARQNARKVGEQFLMKQLRRFHLQVKEPVKRNGYDFMVKSGELGTSHSGCPVVFKVSCGERIHIRKQDEKVDKLLLVFIWHANTKGKQIYAVPFAELFALFRKRRHTATPSYSEHGNYSVRSPDPDLRRFMSEHRITSGEQLLVQMRAALQEY